MKNQLYDMPQTIPPIIHQIWENDPNPLPPFLTKLTETWKEYHPEWQYEFWDKERMDHFIRDYYPDLSSFYDRLKYNVQRWDFIRYLILYEMGGLYVDVDFECLENFDRVLQGKSCCFALEHIEHVKLFNKSSIILNGFIGSIPKHPFLKKIIEVIQTATSNAIDKFNYVLETTGPYFITQLYNDYEHKDEIFLFDPEQLVPLSSSEIGKYVNGTLSEEEVEAKIQQSMAIHYYYGSWYK